MRRSLVTIAYVLLAAHALVAQSKRVHVFDAVKSDTELPKVSAALARDIQSNNATAIEHVLTENFVLVDSSGALKNKSQFIFYIRSGHVRAASLEVNDVQFQFLGETALISGRRSISSESNCADISAAALLSSGRNADEPWAAVEHNFRRRADLVPIIFEALLSAGVKETQVMSAIASARSHLLNVLADAPVGVEAQARPAQRRQAILSANADFDEALLPLRRIPGSYPQLLSHWQFLKLMDEFDSTEHRILSAKCTLNKALTGDNLPLKSYTVRFLQVWVKLREPRTAGRAGAQLHWRLMREQLTLTSLQNK
jgi:hypothetical protein